MGAGERQAVTRIYIRTSTQPGHRVGRIKALSRMAKPQASRVNGATLNGTRVSAVPQSAALSAQLPYLDSNEMSVEKGRFQRVSILLRSGE